MDIDSPSTSRPKRQKIDKHGRFAALEKLKSRKAGKIGIDIGELENVYDEVDEKEYLKTVSNRQNSDWIVDDGGGGYVEDGREIFDDDLDDESIQKAAKTSMAGPRKRKREDAAKKGSIVNMFQNANAKKKAADDSKADDQLLATMLAELEEEKSTPKPSAKPNKFKVTPKSTPQQINVPSKTQSTNDCDEWTIFDAPSPQVVENSSKKPINSSKQLNQSQIIEDPDSPKEVKTQPKTTRESQIIEEDMSQFAADFDEDMCVDSFIEAAKPNENGKTAEKPAEACPDSSVIENDDLDALIQAVDEKSFCVSPVQKRPKIEDENFDSVISALDKEALWADYKQEMSESSESTQISDSDLSSCITKDKDGNSCMRFYWWDAVENAYKTPGVVNLFGKIYLESSKTFVSCCLSIKSIPRRVYLLPREELKSESRQTTMEDVYKEFNKLAEKHRIAEFQSRKVSKLYAFEREGTPSESEYLEVKYPPIYPAIDSNYSGPAIEHIFGTSVNALELFLMERDIKGPSWLEIKSPTPVASSVSWCKFQINCNKMENVSVYKEETVRPMPPMIAATINVRTTLNSKNNNTEIAMIALLINGDYQVDRPAPKLLFQQHYCFVTHPKDTPWPLYARDTLKKSQTNVVVCETETDLLENFLDTIQRHDPDLLVGYDCDFQFNTIYRRLMTLRIRDASRIGKLKHNMTVTTKSSLSWVIGGRPICDLLVSVKELNVKVRSYDLDSICHAVLKTAENTVKEFKPADCPQFYNSATKIDTLVKVTMSEALYVLTLMFELNVIPLALQITCIAGNILSRTLSTGRAERNEYLLLHAFTQRGYITPDKQGKKANDGKSSAKKKAAYAGGLVLDPKRGFYDKLILLMDFNSLYPSIIQEFNLCFTTIPGVCYRELEDLKLPEQGLEVGVVPTEIRKLVESRKEVKNLMKRPNLSAEQKMQYNIRQLALKLTANSMYGCLGATHCRFYAKGLAALVTSKGREILTHTKTLVESLNHEVIYGDTDSLMINSDTLNYEHAFEIAKSIKAEVNKRYNRLELDIDGVFRYLLLLQKKKYAALLMNKVDGKVEFTTEYKGLDIVRRDWCQLACDVGRTVLDQIFVDLAEEEKLNNIKEKLQDVARRVRNNLYPLSVFVITKQLSKNPNEYPDKKMTHVTVALRLNKAGGRMWKAGDTISYVVCLDGTDKSPQERAYHIDEFKKCKNLTIDCNYYLLNQVFPVLHRICEPLSSVTGVFLAHNLDLKDVYKEKSVAASFDGDRPAFQPEKPEDDPYKNCAAFKFKCPKCATTNEIRKAFIDIEGQKIPTLSACSNVECNFKPWRHSANLLNNLQLSLRSLSRKYYQQEFKCSDSECQHQQRGIVAVNKKGLPLCSKCGRGYLKKSLKESYFWNQLNFYRTIFDIPADSAHAPEMLSLYDTLKERVEKYLTRNRFSELNFNTLRESIAKMKSNQKSLKTPATTYKKIIEPSVNYNPKPRRRQPMKIVGEDTVAKWRDVMIKGGIVENKAFSVGWSLN